MHRDKSKLVMLVVTALVAAIALGAPALAKSTRGEKSKLAASQLTNHATQGVKARERVLNAYGSVRSPTFGGPNQTVLRSLAAAAPATTPTFTFTETANSETFRQRECANEKGRPFGRPYFLLVREIAETRARDLYDRSGFGTGTRAAVPVIAGNLRRFAGTGSKCGRRDRGRNERREK